jgi:hypothetical protein
VTPRAAGGERLLLFNSAIAFALAFPVMHSIHELAHALAAVAMGLRPVLYPGQVIVPGETASQQVIELLAGPAGSLVIGVAILAAARFTGGFLGLFLLWLGALSVQECTGYLMTGPFFPIGDIGATLHLLNAPFWAGWLVLLGGAIGTVFLGRHFTRRLLGMIDPARDRSAQLRSLGLFAWLLGTAITVAYGVTTGLLQGGVNGFLTPVGLIEAFATLSSGIFVFAVRFFMGDDVPDRGVSVGWSWPAGGVIVYLVVSVARTLILGPGLQL